LRETEAAARGLGLKLEAIAVRNQADLDAAFKAVTQARPNAFVTLADGFLNNSRRPITEFAMKRGLPGVFPERQFAEAGGLMAYGPNLPSHFHQTAAFVDKILKGAKPGDIPMEQPTKFELVINLKTAKALGLTIPQSVLLRADEVIEYREKGL
jgi:putative ABC transport system substrate-binding protein